MGTSAAASGRSSSFRLLRAVRGIGERTNDLLVSSPESISGGVLVYFSGDVQDLEERMQKHSANKRWTKRSLERTVELLGRARPDLGVVCVLPAERHLGTYARYENFVPCDAFGVPDHERAIPGASAKHLDALLTNASAPYPKPSRKILVGFSKGCVVLNQLVRDLDSLSGVEKFCWLDGGHAGDSDIWVTDERLLRRLAESVVDVDVRVTPYQVQDKRRPWVGKEEALFTKLLTKFGARLDRELFFAGQPADIGVHFEVLDTLLKKKL